MSSKTEIECLIMLDSKVPCLNEIIEFLSIEKVIDYHTKHKLAAEFKLELPHTIHKALKKALEEDTLQLVDYSWVLLPKEMISITIVTKQTRRDFTWNR